jgi:hypothetical protein
MQISAQHNRNSSIGAGPVIGEHAPWGVPLFWGADYDGFPPRIDLNSTGFSPGHDVLQNPDNPNRKASPNKPEYRQATAICKQDEVSRRMNFEKPEHEADQSEVSRQHYQECKYGCSLTVEGYMNTQAYGRRGEKGGNVQRECRGFDGIPDQKVSWRRNRREVFDGNAIASVRDHIRSNFHPSDLISKYIRQDHDR